MSLINNIRGPGTVPCGTPEETLAEAEQLAKQQSSHKLDL